MKDKRIEMILMGGLEGKERIQMHRYIRGSEGRSRSNSIGGQGRVQCPFRQRGLLKGQHQDRPVESMQTRKISKLNKKGRLNLDSEENDIQVGHVPNLDHPSA